MRLRVSLRLMSHLIAASGQEFFVHPLDLTYPVAGTVNGINTTACLNTYQYLTLDPNEFDGFDLILGDAFLRNVYASSVPLSL